MSSERLFRCNECGWRGWLVPLDFPGTSAAEPLPTDFSAIDSSVAERSAHTRQNFSPRNLS